MTVRPFETINPVAEDAYEFLKFWFANGEPDPIISLTMLASVGRGTQVVASRLNDVLGAIDGDGLEPLIWPGGHGPYNLYIGVSPLKEFPPQGRRGGNKLVEAVVGCWLDFDLKLGAFESQSEIMAVIDALPLPPSVLVNTGAGGMHGYWKFEQPINSEKGREIVERWYLLAQSLSPKKIDKLVDPDRMLRLPGSIRWPKDTDGEGSTASVCRTMKTTGIVHNPATILDLTDDLWREHQEQISITRSRVASAKTVDLGTTSDNPWVAMYALAHAEDNFNDTYSWDSILLPLGWTKLSTDEDGRAGWSRPGDGTKRGATTDWPESPNIMSLFTTAPETGLLALKEASIPLTKYRVWIELYWGGDETAAVAALLAANQEEDQ